jgi:hypothetical protein
MVLDLEMNLIDHMLLMNVSKLQWGQQRSNTASCGQNSAARVHNTRCTPHNINHQNAE